jgi:hypothetical protein
MGMGALIKNVLLLQLRQLQHFGFSCQQMDNKPGNQVGATANGKDDVVPACQVSRGFVSV